MLVMAGCFVWQRKKSTTVPTLVFDRGCWGYSLESRTNMLRCLVVKNGESCIILPLEFRETFSPKYVHYSIFNFQIWHESKRPCAATLQVASKREKSAAVGSSHFSDSILKKQLCLIHFYLYSNQAEPL